MLKKNNDKIIAEIHNQFDTAGDKLLAEAKSIISGINVDKAQRLRKIGFNKSNEVTRYDEVKMTHTQATLVEYYRGKYPFNKFITEAQVGEINQKYNLICAPISRYTGFVPQAKLALIEKFSVNKEDKMDDQIKIIKWRHSGIDTHEKKEINKLYPGLVIPKYMFSEMGPYVLFNGNMIFVDKYEKIYNNSFFICAPSKDIDRSGLKKIGNLFKIATTFKAPPDPVVLYPVRGGYLIIAKWGDEASDQLFTNEKDN